MDKDRHREGERDRDKERQAARQRVGEREIGTQRDRVGEMERRREWRESPMSAHSFQSLMK